MTKPPIQLLQRNMQRTSVRAVADTSMDAASAECHLALLESHFWQLCQVQQRIEPMNLEEDSRNQFEAEFIFIFRYSCSLAWFASLPWHRTKFL